MFKKILVPLDGSEIAAKILPQVVELAKTFKAKVTLFHVCYSGVGAFAGEATPAVIKAEEAQEQKFCSTFLAKTGKDLQDQGLDADWFCQDGVPAREIIAYAQDKGYDLIAMGTHGAGEVAWYMGAVADKVASHATVPVLLFRTLEFKPPLLKEVYSTVPGVNFPK
ncbi:MAG: universal stress protein [Syntrophobacterales bacterium]|jgi:nucleotide-binding universal stress UspA family protein|nr:universal stress protein [Syntrophobacterales bacterium]